MGLFTADWGLPSHCLVKRTNIAMEHFCISNFLNGSSFYVSTECVVVETVFCNIMQSFNLSSKQSTFYIYKEILPLELWKAMTEPHGKIISDVMSMSVTELLLFAVIQRRMTASERCPKQLI